MVVRVYSKQRHIYSAKSTKYVRSVKISKWHLNHHLSLPIFSLLAELDRSSTLGRCGQKDRAAIPLSSQSRDTVFYQEQQTNISNHVQLQVTETKFSVSASMRLGTPLLHPAPTHRVEALLQAW